MKKLKDMFTTIRMQTVADANLGPSSLEIYQLNKP